MNICVEVGRNNIFLLVYKYIKLLGSLKSEILRILIVEISFNYWRFFSWWRTVVSTQSAHNIHQLYHCTGNNIYYSDDLLHLWISILKWNNSSLLYEAVCYKKHSQGVTYFREFKSKQRNFPVRISSLCANRCTFHFSIIITAEGASIRSIIYYCIWLSGAC